MVIDEQAEETANQNSVFQVDFELDDAANYILLATLQQLTPIFPADGLSEVALYRFDDIATAFVPIFQQVIQGDFDVSHSDVDEQGQLPAGTYRLYARAFGTGFVHSYEGAVTSSAATSFSFTVSEVPEPATGVLTAISLVALCGWRRTAR